MKKQKFNAMFNTLDRLIEFSRDSTDAILTKLGTSEEGLHSDDVKNRLDKFGLNEISHGKPAPWYVQLVKAFLNPFIIVLICLGVVSFLMDVIITAPQDRDYTTVFVISSMVIVSGLLRFFQEYRSNLEAEKLKALVHSTATVIRSDIGKQEIKMAEVVPGDIIHLAGGDMIPADVRLLSAKDLFVGQSSLTGESAPVEKYSNPTNGNEENRKVNVLELNNICFMGTNIVSGAATAVVIATGNETYFGAMAESLTVERTPTSFDKGVNSVSWLLIRFMLVMVPIVFFINGLTKRNWLDALLFSISIAVGLTPEMLPMIVTSNLAKGAVNLAKRKTVIKRLNAIQNLGAMDILCTDKTGTLTIDKIVLEQHLNIHGEDDDRVLRHAYMNSFFQTGLKNLLDLAILEHGDKKGFESLQNIYTKVDEIPFDFSRRRMSVVLQSKDGKRQLVTKGAVEEMLSICSFAEYKGNVVELTPEIRYEVEAKVRELNNEGMRVIAVAQKNNIPKEGVFSVKDESNMVLMGYVGFLDPLKDSSAAAIQALHDHGVKVKVLTGDNEVVTKRICRDVGLEVDHILLGSDIDILTDEELAIAAAKTTVLAKLSPLQKARVISCLQSLGHTVGFLGDGINDAAALREADVGISVDTATDIAKESADIILLEKSLMVLEEGVVEGRKIFGNIIKYIKMTASSNFGNVFSVLIASAFLPFLPMLPVQLLVQNLLYDISQISIPWDTMDADYLKKPRKWSAEDIGRFMLYIGPISSIFDIITFIVMWFVFKANTPAMQSYFQSGWFIVGLLSQTLIVHMIRTPKIPFIESRATKPVLLLTIVIMALGIAIPFTSFGASIGLQPLPLMYFPWLVVILAGYCFMTQAVKRWYIKKYDMWL